MKNRRIVLANEAKAAPQKAVHDKQNGLDDLEKMEQAIADQTRRLQRKLKRRYRMLYAFITFIGVVLLWYGIWTILSEVPVLSNPYVATGLGIIILLILGQFYDNAI